MEKLKDLSSHKDSIIDEKESLIEKQRFIYSHRARISIFKAVKERKGLDKSMNLYLKYQELISFGIPHPGESTNTPDTFEKEALRRFGMDLQVAIRFSNLGLSDELILLEERKLRSAETGDETGMLSKQKISQFGRVLQKLAMRRERKRK